MSKKSYLYDETGKFIKECSSQQEAANFLQTSESTIRRHIKNKLPYEGVFINNILPTPKSTERSPKILIFDIETAPLKGYIWNLWRQNIYLDQIISQWFMLTWAAKWFGQSDIISDRLTSKEVLEENDKQIILSLWQLIDEADIIVAHYGKGFDVPKFKARCVLHGIKPPLPYQVIDTKEIAAKEFGFSSNKLDALATEFGIANKLKTDFNLWKRCLDGEEDALIEMETYNRMDVSILEKVYIKLRPFITRHPNLGLYTNMKELHCPNCGSTNVYEESEGEYITPMNKYSIYRCADCGAINPARRSSLSKKDKDNLLKPRGK